jgi:hypothetical protein
MYMFMLKAYRRRSARMTADCASWAQAENEPVESAEDGFDIEGLASATPTNYQAFALLLYNESPTRIVSIIRGVRINFLL